MEQGSPLINYYNSRQGQISIMSKGYINITIDELSVKAQEDVNKIPKVPMNMTVRMGQAVTKSEPGKWTNSYLFQIQDESPRLIVQLSYLAHKAVQPPTGPEQPAKEEVSSTTQGEEEEEVVFGECRMDVSPFFQFESKTHVFETEMTNSLGEVTATLRLKLTFYSMNHGKLRIKIQDLLLSQSVSEKYKNLSVRFKLGPFVKTTPLMLNNTSWADPLELVVLSPTLNLTVELLSDGQQIGEYMVYNIEKEGMLTKEPKIVENGLYWENKTSGKIRYEVVSVV